MRRSKLQTNAGGYSFVELLITAALVALIFGGLFAGVQSMLRLVGNAKAQTGAIALANERLEYIRSLAYAAVGTAGAPPYGSIPETRGVTLNGIRYTENVLIRYVDDDADGVGYGSDSNGIIEDYKLVEVGYSWWAAGATSSITLSTQIVPVGVETSAGGGSLRVNVFDAHTNPVSNAAVTIVNDVLSTTTNTTQYTDVNGQLLISGLPTGADYSIWATDFGYSGDGTYEATTTNPNPTTLPIAIAEGAVSTMNFQIDRLSDMTIRTEAIPVMSGFIDDLMTTTNIASFASTTHATDKIELADNSGSYYLQGTTTGATSTPATIDSWYAFDFTASTSASTTVLVSLYYDTGSGLDIVPDSALPGNSLGFTSGPVDIQALDPITYDSLALVAVLSTTDSSYTPELRDWELSYIESQGPLSGIPIRVTGDKTIGTDGSGLPVYKFSESYTTDASGEVQLSDIEYDLYTIDILSSEDVLEVCPTIPYYLEPNTSESIAFTLGTLSGSFLRVTVVDSDGDVIPNASVQLENTGYDVVQDVSLCGQTYFNGGGLYNDAAYTLTVSASGYSTEVITPLTVSATASTTVTLSPS